MRISCRLRWSASAAAAGMWLTLLPVMANGQEVLEYPSQASFPNENREAVTRHLANANSIAGADLWSEFRWRCMISPLDRDMVWGVQHDGLVPATRLFDNLYSVGQNSVSSFALDTDEGIILIDALNSTDEAREIIIPNLRALGLDPARIRYVIVTHGHGDHYGGAKYLQETYGARVVSSATDWQMMEDAVGRPGPFGSLVPPTRDIVAEDGDTISLGATTVRLAITPGHTPGTLSLIFPVYEDGQQHMAGLMGGSGGGRDSETHHQQIASLHRWNELTAAAGVDVLLTNHPPHMDSNEKLYLLSYEATDGANPFIYGRDKYRRYFEMLSECSRVALARLGETGDD